jgi:putative membrane protein
MHMIQHLLLIMFAPPLLLSANPMPFILWGLPARWRLVFGRLLGQALHRQSAARSGLRALASPGLIWLIWVVTLVGWHDPNLYNAALRREGVHILEHLSFFLPSMLLWWNITGAGPRVRKQAGLIGRIALVIAAIPPNMLIGIALAFATGPVYSYYTAVPRLWGIDVLTDQQIGGVIMWVPGSMMYIVAALILIARLLEGEDRKPPLPESEWATEEALIAPGLKR